MKIFEIVQKQYAVLGISSSQQSTETYPISKKVFLGLLLFGYTTVSEFVYTFYMSRDFMEYVECICSLSGNIIIFICFAAVVIRERAIFEMIGNIEKFIDTRCKSPKSRIHFQRTIQRIERLCEIVFIVVVKISVQLIVLPKCIVSFASYFITDSGPDSFQLPLPMWYPFDWNNPIGYLIAVILEYVICGYELFTVACTLALGIGAYWVAISATKEIQRILHSINNETKAKTKQSNDLKILLSDYIDAHATIKQLINDFSAIFQPIIMSIFTWSLSAICGVMLIIQIEILHHGNVMNVLLNATLNGIYALILVLIDCELGQRMSNTFDEINFKLNQSNWYLFPIKIKRMLPIIIANTQQPVSVECFGSIACNRDVFKNIIHHAYSYFMVLRQLGD